VDVLPKVPHEKLNQYYWNADVVIDRFKLGSLGMVSLEAIACGRPVITYVSSEYPEYNSFPLKDVATEDEVIKVIETADNDLWGKEYNYFRMQHVVNLVLEKLMKIYVSVRSY
jgi:glycosyltransferase involved in cell wall biosynthesis